MGLLHRFREFRDSFSSTISFPADYFAGWFGVAPSESGVEVNELTAMQISSYVGCVRIISGAIAALPLRVWETMPTGEERLADDHPLDYILNNQPNEETTAADFFQTGQGHLLMTGNAFAEIAYNGAGQPASLILRNPFRTIPYRDPQGKLIYKNNETPTGHERWIAAEDLVHIKGLGMDSLVGLSPVKYYAREVLGTDLAAQSYSAKFFANDSRPGGYITYPGPRDNVKKLNDAQMWIAAHSRGNSHSMAILDSGAKWEKVGVNPDEAQFIQTRKLNREQISAIFGVPVHFLGESVESRANMEQRGIEFLTYTIKVWLQKWEQSLNIKLFPRLGRKAGRYHCRFDTTMFERATYADLLKGIQMGRYAGIYTVNEARKLLGEQPYSQEQHNSKDPADKLWMPVNMIYVTEDMDPPGPAVAPGQKGAGQGGNDQSGGNGSGTGKPPRQTGQGGKRSDEEIKRYFLLFSPAFHGALRHVLEQDKPAEKHFRDAFLPVLRTIAATFSFRADADPGDMALSAETETFLRGYIPSIVKAAKGFPKEMAAEIAAEQLKRTLQVFREHCQPPLLLIDQTEETPDIDEEVDRAEKEAPIVKKAKRVNIIRTANGEAQGAEVLEEITTQRTKRRKVNLIKTPDGTTTGAEILEE